ncbi:hypothetical protein V6Z12_D12G012200 [Gossypium hirsutum]
MMKENNPESVKIISTQKYKSGKENLLRNKTHPERKERKRQGEGKESVGIKRIEGKIRIRKSTHHRKLWIETAEWRTVTKLAILLIIFDYFPFFCFQFADGKGLIEIGY